MGGGGGLDGKGVCLHSNGQGSNLMGGVVCDQQWYVDQIFPCRIPIIGA
jgi:hypothetical protein